MIASSVVSGNSKEITAFFYFLLTQKSMFLYISACFCFLQERAVDEVSESKYNW